MFDHDGLLLALVVVQPFMMLGLLFLVSRKRLPAWVGRLRFVSPRSHVKGARYFECAVYPRLSGRLRFTVNSLAFCSLFFLYDVDLVFFFAEVASFEPWSCLQLLLVVCYLIFFLAGLYYDCTRTGFAWDLR